MGNAKKCTEQWRIGEKGQEVSILRTNSTMALNGAEPWGSRSAERRKVNNLEMKCLRRLVGVSQMY